MSGRSTYTEEDRAFVYVTLLANDGNVKRTARDTGIPEQTVRRWKAEFEENPPDQEAVSKQADEQVADMERVEKLALSELERKIRAGEAKVSELITVVGVLNDKKTRAKGAATSRTEHRVALPSREEIAELLGGAVATAIQAAEQRQEEIVDAQLAGSSKALPQLPAATIIDESFD